MVLRGPGINAALLGFPDRHRPSALNHPGCPTATRLRDSAGSSEPAPRNSCQTLGAARVMVKVSELLWLLSPARGRAGAVRGSSWNWFCRSHP